MVKNNNNNLWIIILLVILFLILIGLLIGIVCKKRYRDRYQKTVPAPCSKDQKIYFGSTPYYLHAYCDSDLLHTKPLSGLFNWTAIGNYRPNVPFISIPSKKDDNKVIPYFITDFVWGGPALPSAWTDMPGPQKKCDIRNNVKDDKLPTLLLGNSEGDGTIGTDYLQNIERNLNNWRDDISISTRTYGYVPSWSRWTPIFVDDFPSPSPCGPSSPSPCGSDESCFNVGDKFYLKHSYEDKYIGISTVLGVKANQPTLVWGDDAKSDNSILLTFSFENCTTK